MISLVYNTEWKTKWGGGGGGSCQSDSHGTEKNLTNGDKLMFYGANMNLSAQNAFESRWQ